MKTWDRSFGLRSILATALIAVVVAVTITILAERAFFNDAAAHPEPEGATVRISAFKSESGAVRVALQQQQAGGIWGNRQHPDLNTVGATARTDVWLSSSPLQLAAPAIDDGPLFCVITHGSDDDNFWQRFRAYVHIARVELAANVRYGNFLDGADQAAAIGQCVKDGAAVIASTLADPDSVIEPLLAAKASGVRIITFNSGAEFAAEAGSELHIALDDAKAGALAGRLFAAEQLTGPIACVVHEEGNVGLEKRCDALESSYAAGAVERIRLTEGATGEQATDEIAQRLRDAARPTLVGILALNSDTMLGLFDAVIETRDELDQTIRIGAIGQHQDYIRHSLADKSRHRAFVLNDMVENQAYQVTTALLFTHSFHVPGDFIEQPLIVEASPFAFSLATVAVSAERLQGIGQHLRDILAAPDEWSEGWD